MLNKIIHLSLRNRISVLIITALVLLGGIAVLTRMEVDIFPDLNAPTVVVMTEAQGLAPEEVEKVVTYPIETAVNGATGVRRVRSASNPGFSVVWVEFDWGTDIYTARQIVSERLLTAAENLPENISEPVMGPQSSILGEMMIVGLTADSTSMLELRRIAEKDIRPRLLALGGVANVSVIGGDAPEYQIKINPELMRLHDVSLSEVMDAAEGLNNNAGGGVVYQYGNEYIVKAELNTGDCEELGQAVVRSDERGILTLADIATVEQGARMPRIGLASVRTAPAVLITVTKQPAEGTIQLTERVDKELESIKHTLPSDVKISSDIFRQSDFIESSIGNLQSALLEGALFVIIVLFFFLMNLRTTLISIVAIPLSIIVTVLMLYALGITINTMTLGGIAIAIGCLVDDAIVDVENVYKRLRQNASLPEEERRSVLDVVYHASAEVRMPIFNSTLVIAASFIPLFFLTGMEGRMLVPLGVAFLIALAASTIVALTLTPVLCSYLLGNGKADTAIKKEPKTARALREAYVRSLTFMLGHKKALLITVGALFVISLVCVSTLGRGFLPGFNEGSFTINVSTLPGISLEESDRIGREAERIVLDIPEVLTVARKTGRAELDEHSQGVNSSEIEAPYRLKDRSRNEMVRDLRSRLSEIPGINLEIGQPISHRMDAMLSGTEAQIAIKLFGADLNTLFATGQKIKKIVAEVPGIADANIEQQIERPQLHIKPRRDMLARYGITLRDFTEFVDVALAGKAVSQVYDSGLPYDITVKFDSNARNSIKAISELMIDSNSGKIPLSYVADVVSSSGPNTINRENVSRRLVISANVDGRDLRGAVNEIQKKISDEITLPEGYYITYGGQFESQQSASRVLSFASLVALLVILLMLFQEFKQVKLA
ncbi:MAG: efflux RND transporter permease subunit, partial [Muribaculaceae bacterium]|nr:efflux RND transporter permease subunit [Muribaculaceae bacterium]